jgi:hypothetical protein
VIVEKKVSMRPPHLRPDRLAHVGFRGIQGEDDNPTGSPYGRNSPLRFRRVPIKAIFSFLIGASCC